MLRWYAASKGLRSAWAFYAAQRRFDIPAERAKLIIDWNGRYLEPIPPDAECARWLRADFAQARIVNRYQAARVAERATA